ncbi:MAG: hypothetical protein WA964_13870 [Ilumatobacter sp.]|uniref:hypothetical protein n=1 Tax=Ilumatobacter sp. TaxID=1967498 RepID=UPI003C712B74
MTPTTIPTSAPEPDPVDDPDSDSVLFDLADFDIEVTLRPTSAPTPPSGYDGFHTVVPLDDGSLMASGFDDAGDVTQPERSALWRSDDGSTWERIGVSDVSSQPDQQVINSLVVGDDSVRAYGVWLDSTGPTISSVAIGRWTTIDGGDNWVGSSTVDFATARRAALIDGRYVTVGAGDVNGAGTFYGLVTNEASDQSLQSVAVDVNETGDPVPGSDVYDLLVRPDEWLAVGSTTLSDPGQTGLESYFDAETLGFPSDVAVWSSTDAGGTWERLEIERFSGEGGTQAAVQIADDGERRWMLVTAQKFGVFALDLLTSTDGRSWDLHPYRRPTEPSTGDVANARGVYFVEGAIVVIDEIVTGFEPSLVMSVIDPATDEIVSHDLTERLGGVHQIEDLVQLDDLALGVGRVERGPSESDLQTIEVRRIQPDEAPPEPVPSTTTAPSGGSSDA